MSGSGGGGFDVRIIGGLIVAGIISGLAFVLLSAFGPDTTGERSGAAHAQSRSGISYSILTQLLDQSVPVEVVPGNQPFPGNGLVVLTPPFGMDGEALRERLDALSPSRTVLIILPKWMAAPSEERRGWTGNGSVMPTQHAIWVPENGSPVTVELNALDATRVGGRRISGYVGRSPVSLRQSARPVGLVPNPAIRPVIVENGATLLGALTLRQNTYVLADADLLNNAGIVEAGRAAEAIELFSALGAAGGVNFDVGLNGIGGGRSLLRLAVTPPFVGMTLCLLVAGLMILWAGFQRFGPAWRDARTVALGKGVLLANASQLIVQTGRLPRFAERYALALRDSVATRLHAPVGLESAELNQWLDRFKDHRGQSFSPLFNALTGANTSTQTVARAAALGQWRKDVLRDSE